MKKKRERFKRASAFFLAAALALGGFPVSSLTVQAEGGIKAPEIMVAAPELGETPGKVTVQDYNADKQVTFTGQKEMTAVLEDAEVSYLYEGEHRGFKGRWTMTQEGDDGVDLFDIRNCTPFYIGLWAKLEKGVKTQIPVIP